MVEQNEFKTDLDEAFRGVDDLQQKFITLQHWIKGYLSKFTNRKHSTHWDFRYDKKEEPDSFKCTLLFKEGTSDQRTKTHITIVANGLIKISDEMKGEHSTWNIENEFYFNQYSPQDAFGKIIHTIRTSYCDEIRDALLAFNNERIKELNTPPENNKGMT